MSTEKPNCFGLVWDAPSGGHGVEECIGCSVQGRCKDDFINNTLRKALEDKGEDAGLLTLATTLGVSEQAIDEGREELKKIMDDNVEEEPANISGTEDDPGEEAPKTEETVKSVENKPADTKEEERQIPYKKRRGRKPANLVKCDTCNGTGWVGDSACTVCGGFGDHAFQVEADKKAGQKKTLKRKKQEPANKEIASGNAVEPRVGGGDAPGIGETIPLPLQGEALPDTILDRPKNSGSTRKAEAANRAETPKGNEKNAGLVGGSILQARELIELASSIEAISVNYKAKQAIIMVNL